MSKISLLRRAYRALRGRAVRGFKAGQRAFATPRGKKAMAFMIGTGGAVAATAATALVEELVYDPISRSELNAALRARGVTDAARMGDLDDETARLVGRYLGGSIRDAMADRDELIAVAADAAIETADVLDVDVATALRFVSNLAILSVVDDDILEAAVKQRIGRGYGSQSVVQSSIARISSAKELAALPAYLDDDDEEDEAGASSAGAAEMGP